MQVDYVKYPDIPPGCQMNLNKKTGAYQVFREGKNRSPWCKTKRESIGRIDSKGRFTLSKTYLLQKQLHQIQTTDRLPADEQTAKVVRALSSSIKANNLENRRLTYKSVSMTALLLGALMQALTGDTDCVSISDFIVRNKDFFKANIPDCDFENVSHDTIRRTLMLIDPDRFANFYMDTISGIVRRTMKRVVAADGQAVRASGKATADDPTLHGASMFMNFYDTTNRVCLAQRHIDKKTNEITVGPQMIQDLDLHGTVVTADAMSCQVGFVEAVLKQADYCISLKGNQNKCWKEVSYLFNSTHEDQIKTWVSGWDSEHGRVEQRTVSMISGSLLSKVLRDKWLGLSGGSVIRVRKESTKKSTQKTTCEERFYISSLPAKDEEMARDVGEIIRAHWGIENSLHWMLDNLFRQDRMQADNQNYLTNRCALNKLALALLENYRFYLWDQRGESENLSVRLLQQRCRNPSTAIECIACALGLQPNG